MSKPSIPGFRAARRWTSAVPVLALIVAAGHFGCNRNFQPPPVLSGVGGNQGVNGTGGSQIGVGGNPGNGGFGGIGGFGGTAGIIGRGGQFGQDGGVDAITCAPYLRPGGVCAPPSEGTCYHDSLPYYCNAVTLQWLCPAGTVPAPPYNCGTGGAGGQCELLPVLGIGGASGFGGAVGAGGSVGAAGADGGSADGGSADGGTADGGGFGGAPAGKPGSFGGATSYAAGGHPQFVALADMDGDGRLDIVVTSTTDGGVSLNQVNVLLNRGGGVFAKPASYTVPGAFYLVIGDVNGDGKPDVATDMSTSPGISSVDVLLNNGDGTLATPSHNYIPGPPNGLALADVDGDGHNEVIATYSTTSTGSGVVVFSQWSNGSFIAEKLFAAGTSPIAVAAGDLNGDGQVDLAVVGDFFGVDGTAPLNVLLNQGGGNFAPPVAFQIGEALTSVAEADLNGDGRNDLVAMDTSSGNLFVLFNLGGGTFAAPASYGGQRPSVAFALGDVTGDDRFDIVTGTPLNYGASGLMFGDVSVMANAGNGIFALPLDSPDEPIDGPIALGDLNGDGKLDVVAVNHTYNCFDSVSVLLNTSP